MVVSYRRFGTTYRFSGQALSSPRNGEASQSNSWTAWHLKDGAIGCPETSVRNHHSTLRKITKECWTQGLHAFPRMWYFMFSVCVRAWFISHLGPKRALGKYILYFRNFLWLRWKSGARGRLCYCSSSGRRGGNYVLMVAQLRGWRSVRDVAMYSVIKLMLCDCQRYWWWLENQFWSVADTQFGQGAMVEWRRRCLPYDANNWRLSSWPASVDHKRESCTWSGIVRNLFCWCLKETLRVW